MGDVKLASRAVAPGAAFDEAASLPLQWLVVGLGLARDTEGWSWFARGDWSLIAQWRLPRVLAALAAGGMLALAGVLIQRLTGNPLASPEVLGISSSCGLGLIQIGRAHV